MRLLIDIDWQDMSFLLRISVMTPQLQWEDCRATGFHKSRPEWLAVWLLIIVDNTLHLTINYLAVSYL